MIKFVTAHLRSLNLIDSTAEFKSAELDKYSKEAPIQQIFLPGQKPYFNLKFRLVKLALLDSKDPKVIVENFLKYLLSVFYNTAKILKVSHSLVAGELANGILVELAIELDYADYVGNYLEEHKLAFKQLVYNPYDMVYTLLFHSQQQLEDALNYLGSILYKDTYEILNTKNFIAFKLY